MTKDECKKVKDIIKHALAKEGYDVDCGAGTYNETDVRFTIKVMHDREDSRQAEWDVHCWKKGLKSSDFGRIFSSYGEDYQIVGWRPRARKYQIATISGSTGKDWVWSADLVKLKLRMIDKEREGLKNPIKDVTPRYPALEG